MFSISGQIRVYIRIFYKNTPLNALIGLNSYFISSLINWSGELEFDAAEVQGNNEVKFSVLLLQNFWPYLFLLLNAIFPWYLFLG